MLLGMKVLLPSCVGSLGPGVDLGFLAEWRVCTPESARNSSRILVVHSSDWLRTSTRRYWTWLAFRGSPSTHDSAPEFWGFRRPLQRFSGALRGVAACMTGRMVACETRSPVHGQMDEEGVVPHGSRMTY